MTSSNLDDDDANRFCGEIVQAIQVLGKPYDVDHASFAVSIRQGELDSFLDALRLFASVQSITPAFAHEFGVEMWSVMPNADMLASFQDSFAGRSLRISIAKWRLFYHHLYGKLYICPIIMAYCSVDNLGAAWQFDGSPPGFHQLLSEATQTPSCNKALAEFRLGVFLLEVLWAANLFRKVGGALPSIPQLDGYDARVTFGPRFGSKVLTTVNDVIGNARSFRLERQPGIARVVGTPNVRWNEPDFAQLRKEIVAEITPLFRTRPTITAKLASIFEALQRKLEGMASDALRKVDRPARVAGRLLFGFSPDELKDLADQMNGHTIDSDLISLGIDVGDTNGMLVPKTLEIGGQLGRYLAYGESSHQTCIPLLKAHVAVAFGIFLAKFRGVEEFGSTELEKTLVFALEESSSQSAVRAGYPLSRALYCNSGQCQHEQGKLLLEATVHGHYLAIDLLGTPRTFTGWLIEEGLVTKSKRGKHLVSGTDTDRNSHIAIDERAALDIAERIDLASHLEREMSAGPLNPPGQHAVLVALTSCTTPRRFCYAIWVDLRDFMLPSSKRSPFHVFGGKASFWNALQSRFSEIIANPKGKDGRWKSLGQLINARTARAMASEPAHELTRKLALFNDRASIAGIIKKHFQEIDSQRYSQYVRHLQPSVQEMETDRRLNADAQAFLMRVCWLAATTGELWKAFEAFLVAFNLCWLFPQTSSDDHIQAYNESVKQINKSISRLEKIVAAPLHVPFDVRGLSGLEARVQLGHRPDILQAKAVVTEFVKLFEILQREFLTNYQGQARIMTRLDHHFPDGPSITHRFRIRIDCRGTSQEATEDRDRFEEVLDFLLDEFSSAVRPSSGAECVPKDGDGLVVTGSDPLTVLLSLKETCEQTRMGRFLRVVSVHDTDAVGLKPAKDPAAYSVAERFAASMDGAVHDLYSDERNGSIVALSYTVVQRLGGQVCVEKALGSALTPGEVVVKGEIAPRLFWHAFISFAT